MGCFGKKLVFIQGRIAHKQPSTKTFAQLCKLVIILYVLLFLDAGDKELFNTLENNLVKSLPTDAVEWRRSFDRPIRQVKLGATFIPFTQEVLPSEKDCHLIKRPIFHTYWSECSVINELTLSLLSESIFHKSY